MRHLPSIALMALLGACAPAGSEPTCVALVPYDARTQQQAAEELAALRTQRFFPAPHATSTPYMFAFDTCSDAIRAYRERLPKAIELAKAVAVAELLLLVARLRCAQVAFLFEAAR